VDNILLFGGSFDPLHHGHLIVSRFVAEQLGISRVILLPSAMPPHKLDRRLTPADQRLAMCRLAVADDPLFEVSAWETEQTGPNYTLLTIRHFRAALGPHVGLHWLIGMDSLHELGTWYHAGELVDECTIVSTARPGFPPPGAEALAASFSAAQVTKLLNHVVEGPRIDIAGTEIRARAAAGRSIRYLVPEPVRRHIEERGVYGVPRA
jgi:nicotinate-nucleotide adenylyltransferase